MKEMESLGGYTVMFPKIFKPLLALPVGTATVKHSFHKNDILIPKLVTLILPN